MSTPLRYINRITGEMEEEHIYGGWALRFLYGSSIGLRMARLICQSPWFSALYGWIQKRPRSRRKVIPFVKKYKLDPSEFAKPLDAFTSFNDFFTRKLKESSRPLIADPLRLAAPADGRYLVIPTVQKGTEFQVKGASFDLDSFLRDSHLAQRYEKGSLVSARLCPTDYHRFHFPCAGIPGPSRFIQGALFSVSPLALAQRPTILWENRRYLCELDTEHFGKVLIVEIGATNVGTVVQTYSPRLPCRKGEEKGYFSFGGSSMILLFEKGSITFDQDLINASEQGLETRLLMGESLGTCSTRSA